VVGKGPTSYDTTLQIEFITSNIIVQGGFIKVILANDWTVDENTECTVFGLTAVSDEVYCLV